MADFYRRANRLDICNYNRINVYSITICTAKKQQLLNNKTTINMLIEELKRVSKEKEYNILAYCFMPDHLHPLVEATGSVNLVNYLKAFKQQTGFYFMKKFKKPLWQKSFYDHILRKEEDIKAAIKYIFGNPVRKGLINSYKEYPFLGSFVFNMEDIF